LDAADDFDHCPDQFDERTLMTVIVRMSLATRPACVNRDVGLLVVTTATCANDVERRNRDDEARMANTTRFRSDCAKKLAWSASTVAGVDRRV
jgi:hypothetical protein